MIPIGGIVKWAAIASVATMIAIGLNRIYEYHLDQVDMAANNAKIEMTLKLTKEQNEREEELRIKSREERTRIEQELKIERNRVADLQRMLLIDHDLDRLLQQKPGLILPRVNNGTEAYFKALEEATQ